MKIETFQTVAGFLTRVGPVLYADEAQDSLLLGVVLRLADGHRYSDEEPFLACVEGDGELPVITAQTPPHNLLLRAEGPHSQGALELLVRHLAERRVELPGAHGRVDTVDRFSALWQRETGAASRVGMEQRLYRLTRVVHPVHVRGQARWAALLDADALIPWARAFLDEAVPDNPRQGVRGRIERSIAEQGLLVWEDEELVSMCARTRPTPHGASVSFVYTPPDFRRHGYASACVAELSQRILDSGKSFCTLFTDLANPTSNAIYQRIGYEPVCDFREIRFGVT